MQFSEFLAADARFFEAPAYLDDVRERFALTAAPPPDGWARRDRGVWVAWQPSGADVPEQGWKIHVSSTLDGAEKTIELVAACCVEAGVPFKFLRSRTIVRVLSAKYAHRGSSGKVVTVYPLTEDALEPLLRRLSARVGGRPGPYILSDLRWDDGPLYLRYGSFSERYCLAETGEALPAMTGPDGALVPDLREPVFRPPEWAPMPAALDACRRRAAGTGTELPYRVEEALHFSNGGGIYRAVDGRTGRQVVLREARPHAGLDSAGRDAVARLDREHRMLSLLAGLGVVPELLDRFSVWEHEFIAEEYIEGDLLPVCMATRHPLIYPDPTADELRTYTDWALSILESVERALSLVHGRGIVYADLHPHNIVVRPDQSVALVDFEQAFRLDEGWAPGLGAQGFIAPWAREGAAVDRYALACLRLAVFCPLTPLLALSPDAARTLVRVITERFPVPKDFGPKVLAELAPDDDGTEQSVSAKRRRASQDPDGVPAESDLAAAILASATPERTDRLFPGDVAQFGEWGISVAHGAAGVLWALSRTGACPESDLSTGTDWLAKAARRIPFPLPGLYQGLHGVAWVLDVLGRHEEAWELLERAAPSASRVSSVSLYHGLAGIGLTQLHFARHGKSARQRQEALTQALAIGDRLSRALAYDGEGFAPVGTGLQYGWSGPAAFLVRLYRATGDAKLLDTAVNAVRWDLAGCVQADKGTLQVRDGALNLLYLGTGSAGIAVALHDILAHREDAGLAEARGQVLASLRAEMVFEPGLFEGRAGFILAADHLAGRADQATADTVIELHRQRTAWHAVPFAGHVAYPGRGLLRLSMDLATGTAGVLLALHAARARPGGLLPLLEGAPAGAIRETPHSRGGDL